VASGSPDPHFLCGCNESLQDLVQERPLDKETVPERQIWPVLRKIDSMNQCTALSSSASAKTMLQFLPPGSRGAALDEGHVDEGISGAVRTRVLRRRGERIDR
jgi:hypothetical protein